MRSLTLALLHFLLRLLIVVSRRCGAGRFPSPAGEVSWWGMLGWRSLRCATENDGGPRMMYVLVLLMCLIAYPISLVTYYLSPASWVISFLVRSPSAAVSTEGENGNITSCYYNSARRGNMSLVRCLWVCHGDDTWFAVFRETAQSKAETNVLRSPSVETNTPPPTMAVCVYMIFTARSGPQK